MFYVIDTHPLVWYLAKAKLLNAKLITKDKEIMKSNDVDTIWD